jgi:glucosyl-dolichyl phosphate glucuronosyltransferase
VKISLIIPTHNRSNQLKVVLNSIQSLDDKVDYEIIVVDNNSTDDTKIISESFQNIKYVFEKNTAFSKARQTGAENALGEILLYLDDDVVINNGSLINIIKIFKQNKKCGAIAGKILPKFLEDPPEWTLKCQKSFNGWSLYNKETYPFLKKNFQEVKSGAGPMIAIKKTAYNKIGGFPPDTVGVETNKKENTFNKHYTGPGEYGLCYKLIKAGYKIFYCNDISVYHIISPVRFKVNFWRSRMIGEGYQQAITDIKFFNYNKIQIYLKKTFFYYKLNINKNILLKKINKNPTKGMYVEEIWFHYYKAYLNMIDTLNKNPDFVNLLWKMGLNGVSNENYLKFIKNFPKNYQELCSKNFFYNDNSINKINFNLILNENQFYKISKLNFLIGYSISIFFSIFKKIKSKIYN